MSQRRHQQQHQHGKTASSLLACWLLHVVEAALEASELVEPEDIWRDLLVELRVAAELTEPESPALPSLVWWTTTGPYGELPAISYLMSRLGGWVGWLRSLVL